MATKILFGERDKKTRARWYTELIFTYMGDPDGGFDAKQLSPHHIRLTRHRDGRMMDFWPSTNKAMWVGFEVKKVFFIADIEQYILKMFVSMSK